MSDKKISINQLKFDEYNINRHTKKGLKLIEQSITELGLGRSVVVDKDFRIIAGNGVVEVCKKIGIDKVKVIDTQGDELVVVRRNDLSLDDQKARELSIADNSTVLIDFDLDEALLEGFSQRYNIDFADKWFDYRVEEETKPKQKEKQQKTEKETAPVTGKVSLTIMVNANDLPELENKLNFTYEPERKIYYYENGKLI